MQWPYTRGIMTRHEFDRIFGPFCKAIQVPVNEVQAEYWYNQFKHADARDFSLGCEQCGCENHKYLPRVSVLRNYVETAREMRLEQEKIRQQQQTQKAWSRPIPAETPMDRLFMDCCRSIVKHKVGAPIEPGCLTLDDVGEALADSQFRGWLASQSDVPGTDNLTWLEAQYEATRRRVNHVRETS